MALTPQRWCFLVVGAALAALHGLEEVAWVGEMCPAGAAAPAAMRSAGQAALGSVRLAASIEAQVEPAA